jgi:hypothetical protein
MPGILAGGRPPGSLFPLYGCGVKEVRMGDTGFLPPRPRAVTTLGWVLVGFSALAAVSALLGLIMLLVMKTWAPGGFPPPKLAADPRSASLLRLFQYVTTFAAVQAGIAGFSVYAGVAFLKLRPWARAYFEVVSWLSMAWAVGFGVVWLTAFTGITAGLSRTAPGGVTNTVMVAGVLSTVGSVAVPVVLIWLLRSRHVRPAFAAREMAPST